MSPPIVERRSGSRFRETLSLFMVRIAAIGAVIVLVDVKFTVVVFEQVITIGSGFSADLKGAVIASILVSGFAAVKEYWLGASDTGQTQAATISRIAEQSAPASTPLKAEEVNVTAQNATVNEAPQTKGTT